MEEEARKGEDCLQHSSALRAAESNNGVIISLLVGLMALRLLRLPSKRKGITRPTR